jgi:NAD(P)-dependent dehydrogenase (short-subunit alcohol dehydrogenase family)
MGHLDGRIVVITGAGNGIGREHALLMAREGARVVVNDLGSSVSGEGNDESAASAVVDEIRAAGGEAVANHGDVATAEGAQSLVDQAIETYGALDVLVNNAGILRDRMVVNMTDDDWDDVIRVHLRGHFCPLRAAGGYWRAEAKADRTRKASVINTSSTSGLRGRVGQSNYGSAKAAIASMTIIADQELAKSGVRVNAIAPGARTRMTDSMMPAPTDDGTFDRYSPANISPLVAYLATADAPEHGRVYFVHGAYVGLLQPWHVVGTIEQDDRWDVGELATRMRELDIELAPSF